MFFKLPKNFIFIIPTRKGSQRVKNKNIRKFHNTNLLELKIKQILRVFYKPKIILSTDCNKSVKIAKKFNLIVNNRPKKYCTSSIPMKKVYKYLASICEEKNICYTNVTSPLISDLSLKNIAKTYISKKLKSITTVHFVQEYLWYKSQPVNYDPANHPKSQNLKKFTALNFAFTIIDRKIMLNEGKIINNKFHPFKINFPENIDIDDDKDFALAEILYKNNF